MFTCPTLLTTNGWKKILLIVFAVSFFQIGYAQLNFDVSNLTGLHAQCINPTTLQFGPDGKLYVGVEGGRLFVYTISKTGTNSYAVTSTQVIYLVAQIPNHNDDGSAETTIFETRQVTGLLVSGTAANPVLYVSSSDPRVGGGGNAGDTDLDTNSGTISKLTWNGSAWEKVDIVRGLPRSEENHAVNGMQIDKQTNSLYIAVGGITNAGSPSNNFSFITEFALSAAILKVDLNVINSLPVHGTGNNKYVYDIPTLNDPSRPDVANPDYNAALAGSPQTIDQGDPFGGNDGKNQAKVIAGGPVSIYSPGYRNAYDILITRTAGKAGRMYTIDNGANDGWGGYPKNVGTANVNNDYDPLEPGSTTPGSGLAVVNNLDNLHLVSKPGMAPIYGGHPNPVRANPTGAGLYYHNGTTGTFLNSPAQLPADWPPVPANLANPVEGNFLMPGETDGALTTFPGSTNGIAEYVSTSYFNGDLTGDILTADFTGKIWRVKFNADGTQVLSKEIFASGFAEITLDVTTQGNGEVFDGTVWVCDYNGSKIYVFTPVAGGTVNCTGNNTSTTLDDDNDGYSNADETANGTDPCNSVSIPADFDNDKISDKNDPDDDNDGIPDLTDVFHKDANNGMTSATAIEYPFLNNNPGTGLFGLGFTGLMSNGQNDPDLLYDLNNPALVMGGAVGLASFPAEQGNAVSNTQRYGFQFGYKVTSESPSFEIQSSIVGPFFNNLSAAQLNDNYVEGIYIGTGDQDNYLMIAVSGATGGGTPGMRIRIENNGVVTKNTLYPVSNILQAGNIQVSLFVNPVTGKITVKYNSNLNAAWQTLETDLQVAGSLLTKLQGPGAVALGLIASSGSATAFTARYDYMHVLAPAPLVANPIEDIGLNINAPDKVLNLASTFSDDEGAANITLTVTGNTNSSLVKSATISGKSLTLSLGTGQTGVALIKVRATDSDGYWVEDEFEVDVVTPPPPSSIRINSGGPALTMGAWIADQYFTGGETYAEYVPISGTMNDVMYQDERWGDFSYKVPVPNGKYLVRLHFVEIYWTSAGHRLFNVDIENGQGILTNYDIWNEAGGGMNAAVAEEFKAINVTDGFMDINFVSISDNAKISGIEIIPLSGPVVSNAIIDQQVNINTASKQISIANVFTDDGGAANITLSVSGNSNTALIKSAVITGTNLVLGITAGETGFALIKLKAIDADGLFAEDEFKITVIDDNKAPTVSAALPDITLDMNAADKTISLANVFSDDKAVTALIYSVGNNSNISLIKSAVITGSSLKLSLAANKTGTALIKIRATDAGGLFVEDEFKVTVIDPTPPPVPPTVLNPIPDIILLMNAADKTVSLATTFADDKGVAKLKFTVFSNSNPALVKSALITGTSLKLSFTAAKTGIALIKIRATDEGGLYIDDEFKVTVNAPIPPNTAPVVLKPIADKVLPVNADKPVINLSQVFGDDKGVANLKYLVTSNSNTAMITTILSGNNLTVSPVVNKTGTATIKVQATDAGGLKVIEEFKVDLVLNSILINAGGPQLELEGLNWISDHYFEDGKDRSDREAISNTNSDALYQTYREGDFSYSVPVPNGTYIVKLHFAELQEKWIGRRLFNVYIENNQGVLRKYDILAKAGGPNKAVIETFNNIKVIDGKLNLAFDEEDKDEAIVSGIEIIPVAVTANKAPALLKPFSDLWYYINSGQVETDLSSHFSDDQGESGLQYTIESNSNPSLVNARVEKDDNKWNEKVGDRNGNSKVEMSFAKNKSGNSLITVRATDLLGLIAQDEFKVELGSTIPQVPRKFRINCGGQGYFFGNDEWVYDRNYYSGATSGTLLPISNTTNDIMFQDYRYGKAIVYNVPIINGTFNVVLHFVETEYLFTGSRVFNVDIEKGQGKLINYDILGKWRQRNYAATEQFNNIKVTDGNLEINLNAIKGNAIISGIEIIEVLDTKNTRLAENSIFNAEAKDSAVLLNWNVVQEELASVAIERSGDGDQFENIGETAVDASKPGKSAGGFTDLHPATGINYYRLRFTNGEGFISYSETRSVVIQKRMHGLMVYPNPNVTGIVFAELARQPGKEQIRVKMIDVNGRVILNQPAVERTSNMLLRIKLPNGTAKGIYILQIESNGKLYNNRLVVQ